MKAEEKHAARKEFIRSYISQINWDYLFFRAQMVFGLLLLLGIIGFVFWMN
ncbi:hypothetical protein [Salinimicrobium soli]|uniref:hypothetical protein n=1 Tax=Salinimicrobium soli TaxID=1254399 RepID=UPI003AAF6495